MRDLTVIIDKILNVIPETEDELIAELKDNQSSVSFAAPELMSMWWNEVHTTLCEYIFNENELDSWKETVRQIFVGEI
ncbi:hypothetical protein KQI61_15370 [Anaerocolumna aminovalerica]|uniref:hypothetical protein n=1 Tax=Anaerocolumna aminovalerica TaxID=1527 RepID=UPI001C0EE2AF|nr:hypothetical protein [Anaerocolumna aminovalerica]MBU5333578.1 hypothetical protein [Anaerocolumna aminovalerica]